MGCSTSTIESKPMPANTPKKTPSHHSEIVINRELLIRTQTNNINDTYTFLEVLYKGAYGTYCKVLHNKLNQIRTAKVVQKDVVKYLAGSKTFHQEIEILSKLDHPNIIKLFDCYEDDKNYYVITEYTPGGELYDQILKNQSFNELNAGIIIKQLLSAVSYLHKKNIIHRDIKPENIQLESDKRGDYSIKLVDFGSAIFGDVSNDVNLVESTIYYKAPETQRNIITPKCDIWSCGVILYILLCGYPPFRGKNKFEIQVNSEEGKYSFESIEWDNVSDEAKDLVSKMLQVDPKKRISAAEALQHSWILSVGKKEEKHTRNSNKARTSVFQKLKKFTAKQKLQQASIAFLVHQMSTQEHVKELREVFKHMDKNGEGRLTIDEFQNAYKEHFKNDVQSINQMNECLKNLDQDGNGFIEYEEFLRATVKMELLLTENNLDLAFEFFDSDNSGFLSQQNITKALGLCLNEETKKVEEELVKNLIKEVDSGGKGVISLQDFKILMKKVLEEKTN